ncbi:hypothetical protein ACWC2K_19360 [Streptomyces chattanoogensis]
MKIRLIREETGLPLGLGMALLRRICHGLDSAACSIGYLWPAWDAKGADLRGQGHAHGGRPHPVKRHLISVPVTRLTPAGHCDGGVCW